MKKNILFVIAGFMALTSGSLVSASDINFPPALQGFWGQSAFIGGTTSLMSGVLVAKDIVGEKTALAVAGVVGGGYLAARNDFSVATRAALFLASGAFYALTKAVFDSKVWQTWVWRNRQKEIQSAVRDLRS